MAAMSGFPGSCPTGVTEEEPGAEPREALAGAAGEYPENDAHKVAAALARASMVRDWSSSF